MPNTKDQGLLLSNDELLGGLLENEAKTPQLASILPFREIDGDSQRVARATAADFGVDPLFDTVPVAVTEGVAVPSSATYELKMLVQDVVVNSLVDINQSSVNSQAGVQIQAALCRMLYAFLKCLFDGDESVDSSKFSGLRKLVASSRDLLPNDTTTYLLTAMDVVRLLESVNDRGGRPDFIATSPSGYKNIAKAWQNAGLPLETATVPTRTCGGGTVEVPTLSVLGVPVYQEPSLSSVSIGTFSDAVEAFCGCTGDGVSAITPRTRGGSMVKIRSRLVAGSSQTVHRLMWPVGLVLDREDALARLRFRPMAGTA